MLYFFFSSRRRHTRFDCDWSSDVCSSDLFAVTQPASPCPANPTIIVTDDTRLRAALRAARPGDVIAVSGTIVVTRDDSITTDNVTLTCATPGSGLVAASFDSTGSQVADLITVTARGVVVNNLALDGSNASDSPLFAVNDGRTALAQDVQVTHNDVTCARFGSCVFVAGRSEEHTSELQSQSKLVCRLLLEKKDHRDAR